MDVKFRMVKAISEEISKAGGRALIVGGWVRDREFGISSQDIDVEVFGLTPSELEEVLGHCGEVSLVGHAFGVFKVANLDVDWSLPRWDSKIAPGHKGFHVEIDPFMSIQEASARRDFTMNAMSFDPLTGETFDPFNGSIDIARRLLDVIGIQFSEDPVRVLRGMKFCGRVRVKATTQTLQAAFEVIHEFDTMSVERVWGEWWDWAVKSIAPSMGLKFLRDCGWLRLFPALDGIINTAQDSEWHPEGDVFEHTCHAVDKAAEIARREDLDPADTAVLVFAALLHDVGKAATTFTKEGRIVSPRHAHWGAPIALDFMRSIGAPEALARAVEVLVDEHMFHIGTPGRRGVGRLIRRLENSNTTVQMLAWVIEADHSARPPLAEGLPPQMADVLEMAAQVDAVRGIPAPMVRGQDLLDREMMTPGPKMGIMLRNAHEAQLEGIITTTEQGIEWIAARLAEAALIGE